MLYTKYTCPTSPHSSHRTTLLNTKVLNFASLKSIYRPGCQSEWGIGYYRDNLLAQKLLPYIFWISKGGFLSLDRTAPRCIEHATVAFLERKVLSFIPPTMWLMNSPDLNPFCSVLQEKVYPSRIANVNELKTRLIDEWEHFNPSILDAAIAEWRRCLSACVRVSGAHIEDQFQQVYKFSYFVIYLPKVIKLMES